MTDFAQQKHRFRVTCGEYHVDMDFSKEELAACMPHSKSHGTPVFGLWVLMNRLEADVPNRADGRSRRPGDAEAPCTKCTTGWMVYRINRDAHVCTDCGIEER